MMENTSEESSYWKHYRLTGGIKEKLKRDVQCFQSQDNRDLIVNELKDAVCETTTIQTINEESISENQHQQTVKQR